MRGNQGDAPAFFWKTVRVSWESYMWDRKQQLELDMEQLIGSKLGKKYDKAVYCLPADLYAEYIMWKAGLDESQTGIKIAGRNIDNLKYADDTTLMAESEEELKNLLMRAEEESAKMVWSSTSKKLRSWPLIPSPPGK